MYIPDWNRKVIASSLMRIIIDKRPASIEISECTGSQSDILRVVAYFDIFQYPLTLTEIRNYLPRPQALPVFENNLKLLVAEKRLYYHKGFYSLHNNGLLSHRRLEGNERARKLTPKAFKAGRLIYSFPFVRAVFISGSLSKNFADERADIDFFIITKTGRLWISRTLLHLFKKFTYLTGQQHCFCMNYFVDEEAMCINEQNIYTAIEIATIIPVAGKAATIDFLHSNIWTARFFPSCEPQLTDKLIEPNNHLKRLIEKIFKGPFADHLDDWLMRLTTSRWNQKHRKGILNRNGFVMDLQTDKHYAKSDPGSFQERILSLYERKLIELNLEG